ncbi:hypothetical protein QTP88_015537 [Uroleucon formosanum]
MKYEINSTEVQRFKKPGITSAMKGYCSYSPADSNIMQNATWDISGKNANFVKDNTFSGCIPLKHVFGFCEDYKRILVNCSQQLIPNRSMSDLSLLHFTSVPGGDLAIESVQVLVKKVKVQLTRVLKKVPVVKVDDRERLKLMKIIDSKTMINCAFRIGSFASTRICRKRANTLRWLKRVRRLKSYNSYPPTSFQNKYSLSESGFRYSGVGDIIECFFCGLVLQKWTKDDIPWVEHAKWNPKCIFVLLCKGNEFIENVKNKYVKFTDVCDCNQTKS